MNITITYTDGTKKKMDDIMDIFKPNDKYITFMASTGIKTAIFTHTIKKFEVKP